MPVAAICAAVLVMGVEKCDPDEMGEKMDELMQVETEPGKEYIVRAVLDSEVPEGKESRMNFIKTPFIKLHALL